MSTAAIAEEPGADRIRVAAAVRAHYGAAGLSASALAKGVGMTQSKMSRRTTGAEPFDIDELSAIARYLGIEITDLITGTNLPTRPLRASGSAGAMRSLYLVEDDASTTGNYGETAVVHESLAPVTDLGAFRTGRTAAVNG